MPYSVVTAQQACGCSTEMVNIAIRTVKHQPKISLMPVSVELLHLDSVRVAVSIDFMGEVPQRKCTH